MFLIPNPRNKRLDVLSGTVRATKSGPGSLPGPGLVTPPEISGFLAPGEDITLVQAPVWDGTEVLAEHVWYSGGVAVQTGGTTYTAQVGDTAILVQASAENAAGARSFSSSNSVVMLPPSIDVGASLVTLVDPTLDIRTYTTGYANEFEATGSSVVSVVDGVVTLDGVPGLSTVNVVARNPVGEDSDVINVRVILANEYVNPDFAGGAASGPSDGNNPPDDHAIGFNTVDSAPIGASAPFTWEINPNQDSGRSFLQYAIEANHPDLLPGDRVEIQYLVENFGVRSGPMLCLTVTNVSNLTVTTDSTGVPLGQAKVVSAALTVDALPYTAQVRVGAGPTTNSILALRISEPVLYINRSSPIGPLVTGQYVITPEIDGRFVGYRLGLVGEMSPDTVPGGWAIRRFTVSDSGEVALRLVSYTGTFEGELLVSWGETGQELLAYRGRGRWSGFNETLRDYLTQNVGSPVTLSFEQKPEP